MEKDLSFLKQDSIPLSHQRISAHLIQSHSEDIFEVVKGLFADFKETDECKDRARIAQILFPYFFVKADFAVNINMMEDINKLIKDASEFSSADLVAIAQFIESLRKSKKHAIA